MTSHRVSGTSHRVTDSTLTLSIYDVLGKDGNDENFIIHTGLAASAGEHQAEKVPVIDMGPPLRGPNELGHFPVSVVGNAKLTDDEERKIKNFVDRHESEHAVLRHLGTTERFRAASQMYCVFPHTSPYREENGRYARTRFSCVGFVFEAYKKARITLLKVNNLPLVDIEVIRSAYQREVDWMDRGRIRAEDLGLDGDGPWPVMLCGYLFHSIGRSTNEIRNQPYTPSLENSYFP